jgi:hypothetical protein
MQELIARWSPVHSHAQKKVFEVIELMMVRFIFPDFSFSDKPHQFGDRTVHRMRVYSHISQVSHQRKIRIIHLIILIGCIHHWSVSNYQQSIIRHR